MLATITARRDRALLLHRLGRDFLLEFPCRGSLERLLMTGDGKFILSLPADVPSLRDFFPRYTHSVGDRDVLVLLEYRWVQTIPCCPSSAPCSCFPCPAPIITSASPRRMRSAASATACTPGRAKAVDGHRPARYRAAPPAAARCARHSCPVPPQASRSPRSRRRLPRGSSPGTCATAAFNTCASMSSGRTVLNMPRGALPTGVRTAATI